LSNLGVAKPKGVVDGVSRRVMLVIIAMLAIILLPATMVSLPLSKMVITVSNMEQRGVSVLITVYDASDGYFDFFLSAEEEHTVSCTVTAGTHEIYLRYVFSDDQYYGNYVSRSYSVLPFETEYVVFDLYN
jgi:uncharacterized protein (DUF2141 family)